MINRSPINNIPIVKSNSSSVNGDYNPNQNNNSNINNLGNTFKYQTNQLNVNDFSINQMNFKGNYNNNMENQKSNMSNNSNSLLGK